MSKHGEYFILDDIRSSDFSMYIINDSNNLRLPFSVNKRTTTESISGTDGKRFIEQNYEPKRIPLTLMIKDISETNLYKISKWLSGKKEFELSLSYQAHKNYSVTIEKISDISAYLNGGKMSIEFMANYPLPHSKFSTIDIINDDLNYDTIYYYDSGLVYDSNLLTYEFTGITNTTNMNIYDGSTIDGALPNIIIDGSADDITITHYKDINRTVIKDYITYGNFNGILELNCLLRNSFLNGNVSNATMGGRYFELEAQDITNVVNGNILENTTNTITLDVFANDTDDIYIGNYISVMDKKDDLKRKWYEITDYDGTNKIVTVDGNIDYDLIGRYGIYDLDDSMNYFTIEGTNMNINSIKFDFKYLYL